MKRACYHEKSKVYFLANTCINNFINSYCTSKKISLSFESPQIPFIHKKISIRRDVLGFDPNIFLRPFGLSKEVAFKKGLDLEGGVSITYKANMDGIAANRRRDALYFSICQGDRSRRY